MILLLDIGNTHTHLGLADEHRVRSQGHIPTSAWAAGSPAARLETFVRSTPVRGAALCSVVPAVTPRVQAVLDRRWSLRALELTCRRLRRIGSIKIDYPRPATIGTDRLANALAAHARWGAPVVVVDFGTAVTLDVVDRRGIYVGGIIAPGLAAMTDYLHEKTALLPRIRIREARRVIGRSTGEAMRIGAVRGYRSLIQGLLAELRHELGCRRLPVVATGGYARLLATQLPEIEAVDPALTLDGLRRFWIASQP